MLYLKFLLSCKFIVNNRVGIGMDQKEFEGPTIQRVYQYLRRHAANQDLDNFSFKDSLKVEGNVSDCLMNIMA